MVPCTWKGEHENLRVHLLRVRGPGCTVHVHRKLVQIIMISIQSKRRQDIKVSCEQLSTKRIFIIS